MIELLPLEIKLKQKRDNIIRWILLLTVFLVLLLVGVEFYFHRLIGRYNKRLDQFNKQEKELMVEYKRLQQKVELLDQVKKIKKVENQISYVRVINDLNIIIPYQVWLTKFSIRGEELSWIGWGADNQKVVSTLERLAKYPYFNKVDLLSTVNKDKKVNFKMSGRLGYAEK
ncbi:hypothetical protein JCM16358_09320 [Halanaerocella petrolearia]